MDFSNCLTSTISWALSALSYAEDKVLDNVMSLFPKFKVHVWAHRHGSQFHGVVLDDKEGRAWHFHRGTDGFDTLGSAISWFNDMCVIAGKDGTHNGFDKLAHRAFDDCKHYLENYDYIFDCGHSQGAGVSPLDACLCIENLTLKHVQCDLFAAPPCVKREGADRIQRYIDEGKLSGERYLTVGDPIASKVFRNKNSILLNGVDVFDEILLPDIIAFEASAIEIINHSCRIYNATYLQHLILKTENLPVFDLKLLALINNWIEN